MAGRLFAEKMINFFFILTMMSPNDLDFKPMLKFFIFFILLFFILNDLDYNPMLQNFSKICINELKLTINCGYMGLITLEKKMAGYGRKKLF